MNAPWVWPPVPTFPTSLPPSGPAGGDLSGTYPNPIVRVARGLRETGGPTELAMDVVNPLTLLARTAGATNKIAGAIPSSFSHLTTPTNNTIVMIEDGGAIRYCTIAELLALSANANVRSEFWMPPEAAHANDVEGNTSVLPATWSCWDVTTDPAVAMTVSGTVDPFTSPTANTIRISSNLVNRRSWIQLQGAANTKQPFYGFPLTLGSQHVFRMRLATGGRSSTSAAGNSNSFFQIVKDNGAKPFSPNSATGYYLRIGWQNGANAQTLQINYRTSATGLVTFFTSGDFDILQAPTDFEAVIVISGSTAYFWVVSQGISYYITSVSLVGSGFTNVWAGHGSFFPAADRPLEAIDRFDYFRQQDDLLFYP